MPNPLNDLERLLLDNSDQMMMLVEPGSLDIVAANLATSRMLGHSTADLLTRKITDIESDLQDIFYWEDARNGLYREIVAQEGQYLRADGSSLSILKSVRALTHAGTRLLLIQARDLRDEPKTEAELAQTLSQLRATLESTGNGILVIDSRGRIVNMNLIFAKLWALPETLRIAGEDQAILDFVIAAVKESELLRRRLAEVIDTHTVEDIFELHDGRIFEGRSRPQYLGDRVIGRVFSFDDITDRKHAEQDLRESRDQLEAKVAARTVDLITANAALRAEHVRQEELIKKLAEAHTQLLQSEKLASIGQLAAGVAHEINNPVGFVGSNIGSLERYVNELLEVIAAYEKHETELADATQNELRQLKQKVDLAYLVEDVRTLLKESAEGLQRVRQIVRDLKSFAHVDATEMELADLEAGLDSTLNVVWNELKYKAEVVKEYAHIPAVRCIPSQVNQVFMNLLVNAAHAIEQHGRITLRTNADSEWVWVEVEDTGSGIKPEHIAKIFDPFFTTKPVGEGTGLGLALAYQIMQKHGGRIEVHSEPGQGSRFRVVLPRDKAAEESDTPH